MTLRLLTYMVLIAAALLHAAPAGAATAQSGFADEAWTRVNAERTRAGVPVLTRLRTAELAAQLHAMDMANREYMDHVTAATPSPVFPDPAGFPAISFTGGMTPGDRLRLSGYAYTSRGWAENVAYNWGYGDGSPAAAVTGWMASSGHRGNILNRAFIGSGMGAAASASGKVYYCQVFVLYTTGLPVISSNAQLWAGAPPADATAPGSWRSFVSPYARTLTPTCSVRVTDAGTGLDVVSGGYRYSKNGGLNWSGWIRAVATGAQGTTAEQQLTATAVPFNAESRSNRIQFRIADRVGNWGTSPVYSVVTDRTAPAAWTGQLPTRTADVTPDCTVRVADWMSGLRVTQGQYRYSRDGGVTWSGWVRAACTGADGVITAQTLTAAGVPFNAAHATNNRVQFRINDMAGNTGVSPVYTVNTTP